MQEVRREEKGWRRVELLLPACLPAPPCKGKSVQSKVPNSPVHHKYKARQAVFMCAGRPEMRPPKTCVCLPTACLPACRHCLAKCHGGRRSPACPSFLFPAMLKFHLSSSQASWGEAAKTKLQWQQTNAKTNGMHKTKLQEFSPKRPGINQTPNQTKTPETKTMNETEMNGSGGGRGGRMWEW